MSACRYRVLPFNFRDVILNLCKNFAMNMACALMFFPSAIAPQFSSSFTNKTNVVELRRVPWLHIDRDATIKQWCPWGQTFDACKCLWTEDIKSLQLSSHHPFN